MAITDHIKNKIKENFSRQTFMATLGASIHLIEEGKVELVCEHNEKLTQQNGFLHAGVLTSVCDSACGYAALSVMQGNADVLSVEFKTNLLRPAGCKKIKAVGEVVKAGKTLVFCEGKVFNEDTGEILTTMQATMIAVIR